MKKIKIVITILFLLIIYMYISNVTLIPKQIVLLEGENYKIRTLLGIDVIQTSAVVSENGNTSQVNLNMFGNTVKQINVTRLENVEVIPVGKIIGLKLYTNGVLIVGMSEIENVNHQKERPYENLNIQEGDTILKVNDLEIQTIENLQKEINKSDGKNIDLTILKEDGTIELSLIHI